MEHHGRRGAKRKYKMPEQRCANQIIVIKLFCAVRGCNNYTKGKMGYNGGFVDEDGRQADLRNQDWICSKHARQT